MRNAPPCGISFRTKSYPHSAEEVKVCNVHMMTRREWTMVLPQILMGTSFSIPQETTGRIEYSNPDGPFDAHALT